MGLNAADRCGPPTGPRLRNGGSRRRTTLRPGPDVAFAQIGVAGLDAAMRSGRLRHDRNPVLGRCLGNVVGRPDRRGNLYPAKQRPEQKIDAEVALMMAVGRAMSEDANEGDLMDLLRNPVIA